MSEKAKVEAFWEREQRQCAPEMAERKAESIIRHQERLVQTGVTSEDARRTAIAMHNSRRMLPYDAEIQLDGFSEPVRVCDILLDPERFEGATGPDVLEWDYGGGRQVSKVYAANRRIYSQAHGGTTYELVWETAQDIAEQDLETDPSGVLQHLRVLGDDELKAQWMELAARLAPAALEAVKQEVMTRLRIGSRSFDRELKAHRDRETAAALQARRERDRMRLSAGGKRHVIEYKPDRIHEMACEVESCSLEDPGCDLLRLAGQLVQPVVSDGEDVPDAAGGSSLKAARLEPLSIDRLRASVEERCVFVKYSEKGATAMAVPTPVLKTLLDMPDPRLPVTYGSVSHPVVLGDGSIIASTGYDPRSRLYLYYDGVDEIEPYDQKTAASQLKRLEELLLNEFSFEAELDRAAALAMLITTLLRKVMDIAPAFLVTAAMQSSGKTTLCRRIHLVATGTELPVTTPPGDSEESRKKMLSVLMTAPSMICLDNVLDGMTLQDSALAAILTSGEFEDRKLGKNEIARVKTRTVVSATGNNVAFGPDEVSRWLTVRLRPVETNPWGRRYKQPDVAQYARQIRDECIRICLGIVAGYLCSDRSVEGRGRFPQWDLMVRQPLIWAGAEDVAETTRFMVRQSDNYVGHQGLLFAFQHRFGEQKFTATAVANIVKNAAPGSEDMDLHLEEALRKLLCKNPSSPSSVGRALQGVRDRPHECGLVLRSSPSNGTTKYWIEDYKPL